MPTNHMAVAAVPATGATTSLRNGLVARYAYCLAVAESSQDLVAIDPDTGATIPALIQNGRLYGADLTDTTTAHDGVVCLVSYDGVRYKIDTLQAPFSVLSKASTSPPASPTIGDLYLIYSTPSGAWAGKLGYITRYGPRGWEFVLPPIGFRVLVEDEGSVGVFYFRDPSGDWLAGLGGILVSDNTVPLSAVIGFGLGPVRVQNQTTYAPPGSRQTGGTPAMALGGTASDINDNSDATSATTSALGDLSAADFASRIVAQITLAAAADLICIEVRGALGSAASSSSAMGLWYKSGGVWTQAGVGFTLSTTAQNIQRSGSFLAVTDIAYVTEAKNWSTNTNTLAGLNAFDATVIGSVGDSYIIGSPAIGIFAGYEGKVAICEAADAYTKYTPDAGNRVYDIALGYPVEWNGTAWISAGGAVIGRGYGEYIANTDISTPYIPIDDTIPQITEGTQIISIKYQCKSPTSRLRFTFSGDATTTLDGWFIAALFRGAASSAIYAKAVTLQAGFVSSVGFVKEYAPASTDEITYTLRVSGQGNTIRMNGIMTSRKLGAVVASTMVVEEIAP